MAAGPSGGDQVDERYLVGFVFNSIHHDYGGLIFQ
jgi:hypothetical protein